MSALPVDEAARVLKVPPGTLRRWAREGCPVVERGGRGRGCALLIDPAAVLAWRGADAADALLMELAGALPEALAHAAAEAHRLTDGPCKAAAAGVLAGSWYLAASAVLDHLRERCAEVPEIRAVPPAIERLRLIAKSI